MSIDYPYTHTFAWPELEAAVAAEDETARARRKVGKELEIRRNHEAESAALCEESSSPQLSLSRSPKLDLFSPVLSGSQDRIIDVNIFIQISDNEPNQHSPEHSHEKFLGSIITRTLSSGLTCIEQESKRAKLESHKKNQKPSRRRKSPSLNSVKSANQKWLT